MKPIYLSLWVFVSFPFFFFLAFYCMDLDLIILIICLTFPPLDMSGLSNHIFLQAHYHSKDICLENTMHTTHSNCLIFILRSSFQARAHRTPA